ncbi:MAG TPA: GAF domain-containing protein [Acidimicrobiales bacterium]|nr:GAF domain-containing protein [Acidimicrobiales bacterium]
MTHLPDDPQHIARAREHFLEAREVDGVPVRDPILTSWRRSQFWGVPVEFRELPYRPDIDPDSRLARAAQPVLDRLQTMLADMSVSVVLTDSHANVLDRRVGDPSLNQALDAVWLAPGFSYAEQFVGTNAIGTALEEKRTSHVFGSEHFSDQLQTLSCAGTPIRNPITGRTEGVIDVTSWSSDASPLMPALVQQAATEIEQRLLEEGSTRERALLQTFLAANRRPNRAVLTISRDLVIANESAAKLLDHHDHALVRERAAELMSSRQDATTEVVLSGGQPAKLRFRPVMADAGLAGAVVELSLGQRPDPSSPATGGGRPMLLPGLAGRSSPWLKVGDSVGAQCRERTWLLITGEPGVGKRAIAEAAHRRWSSTGHLVVIDVAEADDTRWLSQIQPAFLDPNATVVLAHVDRLGPDVRRTLARLLAELAAGEGPAPWVVATCATAELDGLLDEFPVSIAVPALRHHLEDIRDLVPAFIDRYAPTRSQTLTSPALHTLLRAPWPGNIAQLERVIRLVLAQRRAGDIRSEDLPAECHTTSSRVLTPWERLERDAALMATRGDKVEAARHLGISRATIYRKIQAYGIAIELTGEME